MKPSRLPVLAMALCLLLAACSGSPSPDPSPSPTVAPPGSGELYGPPTVAPSPTPSPPPEVIQADAPTLGERFAPPQEYTRAEAAEGTFAAYLRDLPLKPDGTSVAQHDGTVSSAAAAAVVDIDIGTSDRCQLTDALLLLRARFLFDTGRKNDIQFYFSSGFLYDFTTYTTGRRVKINGNDVRWVAKEAAGDTLPDLYNYLGTLYSYSRAASVKANDTKQTGQIVPGAVFTNDGGAMIADVARNDTTGETLVILVRGGSPASDLYVVKNIQLPDLSPWISVSAGGGIYLDGVTFLESDAREFIH